MTLFSYIYRQYRFLLLLFLLLLLLLLLLENISSLSVFADGGAPQLAYIAGTAAGISIIDIAQRRVTGTVNVAGDPHTILLSPDGHALYVTQPALGRVAVVMAKTGKTLCTANLPGQPSLLALSLNGSVLYAAGSEDSRVSALDPTTCAIQHVFETHQPINGLAVAASTAVNATPSTPNQLWVSGPKSLTIFEVNGHLLGSTPIAGEPQSVSIPAGFTAYVTTHRGTVVAVDLDTRQVIGTLLKDGAFGPMDYDANTGEVYVPDRLHNQLDVLAPVLKGTAIKTQKPTRTIHLSSSPQSVAITSDGQLGFVALANGQVIMLDIPGRSIVTSITVGGAPHFIITGLYPPATNLTPPLARTTQSAPGLPIMSIPLIFLLLLAGIALLSALWLFWRYQQKQR